MDRRQHGRGLGHRVLTAVAHHLAWVMRARVPGLMGGTKGGHGTAPKAHRGSHTTCPEPDVSRPGEVHPAHRHRLPELETAPEIAYQFVHDELMLDGNARLNLATFVTTWMDPRSGLMAEASTRT